MDKKRRMYQDRWLSPQHCYSRSCRCQSECSEAAKAGPSANDVNCIVSSKTRPKGLCRMQQECLLPCLHASLAELYECSCLIRTCAAWARLLSSPSLYDFCLSQMRYPPLLIQQYFLALFYELEGKSVTNGSKAAVNGSPWQTQQKSQELWGLLLLCHWCLSQVDWARSKDVQTTAVKAHRNLSDECYWWCFCTAWGQLGSYISVGHKIKVLRYRCSNVLTFMIQMQWLWLCKLYCLTVKCKLNRVKSMTKALTITISSWANASSPTLLAEPMKAAIAISATMSHPLAFMWSLSLRSVLLAREQQCTEQQGSVA